MNSINVNGQIFELDVEDDMPLLWAIRDIIGFTGTKFGCGLGLCGACTARTTDGITAPPPELAYS